MFKKILKRIDNELKNINTPMISLVAVVLIVINLVLGSSDASAQTYYDMSNPNSVDVYITQTNGDSTTIYQTGNDVDNNNGFPTVSQYGE